MPCIRSQLAIRSNRGRNKNAYLSLTKQKGEEKEIKEINFKIRHANHLEVLDSILPLADTSSWGHRQGQCHRQWHPRTSAEARCRVGLQSHRPSDPGLAGCGRNAACPAAPEARGTRLGKWLRGGGSSGMASRGWALSCCWLCDAGAEAVVDGWPSRPAVVVVGYPSKLPRAI